MFKTYMLVFFPVWMIWGSTMADDMTLMNEHEIEALIGEYSGRKSDQWEQSRINKRICILDIYGNIIRQTEVSDDFPMKDPPILEAFLDKSMFLLEIEGIYYYLYEFSFQGKKNFWTGNFFNELFI